MGSGVTQKAGAAEQFFHAEAARRAHLDSNRKAPLCQPLGESHWAVKRTDMSDFVPSPASCARAPSWVALQTFVCAHEEVS